VSETERDSPLAPRLNSRHRFRYCGSRLSFLNQFLLHRATVFYFLVLIIVPSPIYRFSTRVAAHRGATITPLQRRWTLLQFLRRRSGVKKYFVGAVRFFAEATAGRVRRGDFLLLWRNWGMVGGGVRKNTRRDESIRAAQLEAPPSPASELGIAQHASLDSHLISTTSDSYFRSFRAST